MRKEYTVYQTKCDVCGKVKETPNAIAGHYDSGWRVIDGNDLCDICYGMFVIDVIVFIEKQDMLKPLLKDFIKKKTHQTYIMSGGFEVSLSGYGDSHDSDK